MRNILTPLKASIFCGLACSATVLLSGCNNQFFGLTPANNSFAQSVITNNQVDVLWVVDTSGSMAARQLALANQISIFINALNGTGLDYHIAVTTMDCSATGERGAFIGSPAILTNGTPNVAGVLAQRLQIAKIGSDVERGEEAMEDALSGSNLTGVNAGFLRPNALLDVIFFSDEDDSSVTGNYQGFLNTLKPNLPLGQMNWVAEFIGVVPTDPTCSTSAWNYSSPGTQYIALANASGGASASICGADFATAVTNVKTRVLEIITAYHLTQVPKIETITVFVAGVQVAQGATNGWTYDSTTNTVTFHGTAIPSFASSVVVNFTPAEL